MSYLRKRDFGAEAAEYDQKREGQAKWIREQAVIEGWLDEFPGSLVLDAGGGTGRWLPVLKKNECNTFIVDLSLPMMAQAEKKILQLWPDPKKRPAKLIQADLCNLPKFDRKFDIVLLTRVTPWLTPEECEKVGNQLRERSKRIIMTTRESDRPVKLIQGDWKIVKEEEGASEEGPDKDYRIVMMEAVH